MAEVRRAAGMGEQWVRQSRWHEAGAGEGGADDADGSCGAR